MASSGKKSKKVKRIVLPLNEFLSETSGPTHPAPSVRKSSNWADEVEDESDTFESRLKHNIVLPTAPRAVAAETDERIPTQPPYLAFISNLTYDVDEVDLAEFFSDMKIDNMRLPRDDREGGKLKGFGYIEFEDRESLISAISLTETTLKGRRMRIEVATNSENDRRRGNRMDSGRDRSDRSEVSSGDWRSGPRAEPVSDNDRRSGGFSRDRERNDRERDRNGAVENDRPGAWRDGNDRPNFREDRGYNSDRFNREDRGGRFGDNRGFGPRKNFNDRELDREGGFSKNYRDDKAPIEKAEPRSRPKLVLAPRTKPLEELPIQTTEVKDTEPSTPVHAASIFGAAKPVDTSARERQIEERLAKEKEILSNPPRSSSRDNSKSRADNPPEEEKKKDTWRYRRDGSGSRDRYDRDSRQGREGKPERDSVKHERDTTKHERDSVKHDSPERRPSSRGSAPRRNEERRGPMRNERAPQRGSDKGPPSRGHPDDRMEKSTRNFDRDRNFEDKMPKVKEPEAPNFTASNKFAFLEAEGDLSD